MRAGSLRFRLTVETPIEERDSVGAVNQVWAFKKNIWAAIDPLRGQEKFALQQAKPTVDTKITVRAMAAADISPKDRFVYKGRIFDIESNLDFATRGIMREIYCKEAA